MSSRHMGRREVLALLAVGTASALAGCGAGSPPRPAGSAPRAGTTEGESPPPGKPAVKPAVAGPLPPVPPPHPGPATVVDRLPGHSQAVALTIDDGYDRQTVAAYVQFAADSGLPITFNPNGRYAAEWAPHAELLRPLLEAGQVQIGNHTYNHLDLRKQSDKAVTVEIERNEEWIEKTFGITSRPWFRPPYGFRNARTDGLAGQSGFTRIVMWNGSFGDSQLLTPQVLLAQAQQYLQPGTIMLGHANHPTVTGLYGQIVDLIRSRQLTPQTLDQVFGTSRATG